MKIRLLILIVAVFMQNNLTLGQTKSFQNENFLIGAWVTSGDLIYETGFGIYRPGRVKPIDNIFLVDGNPSSRINVLKNDGINFVWMSSPSPWALGGIEANKIVFDLIRNNGVWGIGDFDYYFKPKINMDGTYINTIGDVVFDGLPVNLGYEDNKVAIPNYTQILININGNPNFVGGILGGELAYRTGHWYNITGQNVAWGDREDNTKTFSSEISPEILQEAIDIFKSKAFGKSVFLQVGTHTFGIQDYTDDFRSWSKRLDGPEQSCDSKNNYTAVEDSLDVDPQDHFQNPDYYPDYLIEGSYYELYLPEYINPAGGISYSMNCFTKPYSNISNCGTGENRQPLGNTNGCEIYNQSFNGKCIDGGGQVRYGDNRHYLSKFHNIDYFRNKKLKVISEVSSFSTSYKLTEQGICVNGNGDTTNFYTATSNTSKGHWNSTLKTNNANYFWFNCYNSIIHGVSGIIPYIEYNSFYDEPCSENIQIAQSLGISCDMIKAKMLQIDPCFFQKLNIDISQINCDCQETYGGILIGDLLTYYQYLMANAIKQLISGNSEYNSGSNMRFNKDYWPEAYKNFVAPLFNELNFLNANGLLNNKFLIANKLDNWDHYCIVPDASTYIRKKEEGDNKTGIPSSIYDVVEDYVNKYIVPQNTGIESFENEFSSENYGLRYSLISNGDKENEEVIMIISNPLNLPILNVPISIAKVPNLTVRQAKTVQWLFVDSDHINVMDDQLYDLNAKYKALRKFNWANGSYIDLPFVDIFIDPDSLRFKMNFGPLDVQVLRFVNNTELCCEEINNSWSNFGSGVIGGHTVNETDNEIIVGNFYGAQDEELLMFSSVSQKWVTLQGYKNGNWKSLFNNSANGCINRKDSTGWEVHDNDVYISGDFILGDGKDELLCIQDLQQNVTNRYSALIGFMDVTADWGYWFWSNYLDKTKLGEWQLGPRSKYFAGNFDDDELDEILFFRFNEDGSFNELMIQKYDQKMNKWIVLFSSKDTLMFTDVRLSSQINIGNFDSDHNRDEIFITNSLGNADLFTYANNNIIHLWTNQGSGFIGDWKMLIGDKIIPGNFLNIINDQIFFIRSPHFNGDNHGFSAIILSFNYSTKGWSNVWNNSTCNNNLICNWPVYEDSPSFSKYHKVDIFLDSLTGNTTCNLLAIRGSENNGFNEFCQTRAIISTYFYKSSSTKAVVINSSNEENDDDIFVNPNPSTGEVFVKCGNQELIRQIEVLTLTGFVQKVISYYDMSSCTLNLKDFSKGSYILRIKTDRRIKHKIILLV